MLQKAYHWKKKHDTKKQYKNIGGKGKKIWQAVKKYNNNDTQEQNRQQKASYKGKNMLQKAYHRKNKHDTGKKSMKSIGKGGKKYDTGKLNPAQPNLISGVTWQRFGARLPSISPLLHFLTFFNAFFVCTLSTFVFFSPFFICSFV